ncbi:hypothetical protein LTR70_010459 [Exophiala xenobiotica]|uniref:Phosphatidic acid phosphatase type 2/haloperoxidase domain-containing protein n=1 Tax=Lithohypha guttulata TaxID=1690604 RepID=A0ABR0JUQ3_9EURO|nr:hypothetical protein LTR24_010423 [Lithohypha guttulata]KAK5309254.1 hypothetical protein LTR70_010459 [Exophiala xenobiotica]
MARPVRVVVSYLLDWVVVICFAAAGGILTYISGFHRPFSLTNDDFAYPLKDNIVSLPIVAIISLVAPAAIIAAANLSAAVLTKPSGPRRAARAGLRDVIFAVAWETHAGWLGLCTGLAVTLFVTAGLKDMVGKPRPDMLARCQPDLTNINRYVVGGFGMNLDSEAPPFVTSAICQQPDTRLLDDGFAAFPSGHSSFNSAGMVYLTLWLCSRWSIAIPFLDYSTAYRGTTQKRKHTMVRVQAVKAAPPLWQVALAFTPIFVALFVCASRYADFHHAGFDIIAGAAIGTVFGWTSFRLYHLPFRRSKGLLAWGPRAEQHAFLARSGYDDNLSDEEQGRQSMGTELDHLTTNPPARVHTGGFHQPRMGNSSEESQHGKTACYPQRV